MIRDVEHYGGSLKESNLMAKSRDVRKEARKKPKMTLKEKRQAKRDKRNK